ncbi:MAG: ABC transporter substrate-binding protein [Chloroflexi bacterium]|nr:ABC transporter substrate-binding protein [Chloroflexota bacterium]
MRAVSKGRIILVFLLIATVVSTLACGPGATSDTQRKRELVIAQAIDPTTLDPTATIKTVNVMLNAHLYDPLINRDRTGKLEGRLAERWENPNSTTWRFFLRKGVKFHNGEEFNAESAKLSLDRVRDSKISEATASFSTIESVTIVDTYTIDIKTKAPDPLLLQRLADQPSMVPPGALKTKGDEEFARNPVGTGPFQFVEWVRGNRIAFKANPQYWRGAPKFDSLVFKVIPEGATRVAALQTGEVDIAIAVPPGIVDTVKKSGNARIVTAPLANDVHIGFKANEPPFNDVRVRQALNYAVNKKAIVESVLGGFARLTGQPSPEGVFGYNAKLQPYPYDQQKARQLLAEAGHANGLTVDLTFADGFVPNGKEVMEAVAEQLRAVGVTSRLNQVDVASFSPLGRAGRMTPLFATYTLTRNFDTDEMLQNPLTTQGPWNHGRYSNARIDVIVKEAVSILDQAQRQRLYEEANQILHDDAAWLYLYNPMSVWGIANSVEFEARPDDLVKVYDEVRRK